MSLWAGLSGATRNACVALAVPQEVLGICEQERITRSQAAGFNATGLPDEALDVLLSRSGKRRSDVSFVMADAKSPDASVLPNAVDHIDHHLAHAYAAFLSSTFESATVVVCDDAPPDLSVWQGSGQSLTRIEMPWQGAGFARVYARCAELLGFGARGREQRMEAMARLNPTHRDSRISGLFHLAGDRLECGAGWEQNVAEWGGGGRHETTSAIAAAVQGRIGELLLEWLADLKRRTPPTPSLCVGGTLFHNSYFNSLVRQSGLFEAVFCPVNPGDAGLALGAALHGAGSRHTPISPFLGPGYDGEEIKATLDNCKLTYRWESDSNVIAIVVDALQKGRLVAWFDGRMEWGPRALGARSILASPFSPYVLDNLNRYLKRREPWRGYALSGLRTAIQEGFEGPKESPFMECDYTPRNREAFRHVLPGPHATVRVHSIDDKDPSRFSALLKAFSNASGFPFVVNTSFNGFSEPIVCSPRDAIRVFYGTGADTLVMGQFVVHK